MRSLILITFLLMISECKPSSGQKLDRLIPLKSTCSDAERLLGGKHCSKSAVDGVVIGQERYRIVYSKGACTQYFGKRLNIRAGAIVLVRRTFDVPVPLKALGITMDERDYFKSDTDLVDTWSYERRTGGLRFLMNSEQLIGTISYFPTDKEIELLTCPQRVKKRQT